MKLSEMRAKGNKRNEVIFLKLRWEIKPESPQQSNFSAGCLTTGEEAHGKS